MLLIITFLTVVPALAKEDKKRKRKKERNKTLLLACSLSSYVMKMLGPRKLGPEAIFSVVASFRSFGGLAFDHYIKIELIQTHEKIHL